MDDRLWPGDYGIPFILSIRNAHVVVTLRFVCGALVVIIAHHTRLVLANRERWILAVRVAHTRNTFCRITANRFHWIGAMRVVEANDAVATWTANGLGCAAVRIAKAFYARLGSHVAHRPPRRGTVQVGCADRAAIVVTGANRNARAMRVDQALLAVATLQVTYRIGRTAIGIGSTFRTLSAVGIANRFVCWAIGIRRAA